MASELAKWHLNRRKQISARYPEIASIPRYNPYALIPILFAPLMHFMGAYSSQYLSIRGVFVTAWILGSMCSFSMFIYSHELVHNLVHPRIKGRLYEALLHYTSLLSFSPSIYILFKFGHKPHHAKLGTGVVSLAGKFLTEKHPDIELLIDRYYFELKHELNEKPRSLIPFAFNNKILRLLSVSVFFPISSTIKGVFLAHCALFIAYVKSFFIKKDKEYQKRINAIFIQLILLYWALAALYLLAGPIAFLYLFLSEASQRGLFFHPIMIFPMTSHKAWGGKQNYQPTTSVYHWLVSLILMRLNYHVEHHDFPDIPCKYLPQVKKIAPEFYDGLVSFKSIFDVFHHYYHSTHWYYADAQRTVGDQS